MPRASFLAVVSAVLLGLAGCGYRTVSYPKRADITGVAVQNFDNESFEYGYEFVLADAMRKEFARRGAWKLVNDPEEAELVVNGSIRPVTTGRRSFSSVVSTLEYEVGVLLRVDVQRPGDVQLGVDSRVVRQNELYLASADIEVTRRNRDEALRRLASTLAQRVHDILYEVAPAPAVSARPQGPAPTAAPEADEAGSAAEAEAVAPLSPLPPLQPLPPSAAPPPAPLPSVEPPAAAVEPPAPTVEPPAPAAEPPAAVVEPPALPAAPAPEPPAEVESEGVGEGADWVPPGQPPLPPLEAEDPVPETDTPR